MTLHWMQSSAFKAIKNNFRTIKMVVVVVKNSSGKKAYEFKWIKRKMSFFSRPCKRFLVAIQDNPISMIVLGYLQTLYDILVV